MGDVAIVIPARFESQRFPGKPLAMLRGAGGQARSLIARSYEAASAVPDVARLFVATDDARIAEAVYAFGGAVVMTPSSCRNGTERVAAALPALPESADIIINFQGDALLTPASLVTALIVHMRAHPECMIATVAVRCSASVYQHLVADQAAGRVGGTTVVANAKSEALYFSKRVLPYIAPGHAAEHVPPVLLHIGLYAYRRAGLALYAATPETQLETLEGLEQLRFLVAGAAVALVVADAPQWDVIELNNPSDIPAIEAVLQSRAIG